MPIQLRFDEATIALSVDDHLATAEAGLFGRGLLPPEATALPERWPKTLPAICYDFLVATDPEKIDLDPDPATDPKGADRFKPINDGTVDRIEIEDVVLRVEESSLNFALPPVEIQAAADPNADPADRQAWRTLGTFGGGAISPGCGSAAQEIALGPASLGDLPIQWERSGESFLDNRLGDPTCKPSTHACKKLALRARSRIVLDTGANPDKPHGALRLRLILVATFYVLSV